MQTKWPIVKLEKLCKLQNGFDFKSNSFSKEGVPLVRISNIKNRIIDLSDSVKIKESDEFKDYLIKKGDLLIAMSGATTGKMGVYLENQKIYQNQRVGNFKIIKKEIFNPEYRNYIIMNLQEIIKKKSYGGAQPNISPKKLKQIRIPLPPMKAQKKIVEVLSTWDQAIEKMDQLISAKEKQSKWLLKTLITDQQNNPNWKTAKIEKLIQLIKPIKKIKNQDFQSEGIYPIIDQSQLNVAGWTNDEEAIIIIIKPVVIFGDHTCSIKYVNQSFAQGADGIKILKTSISLLPKFLYFFLLSKPIRLDGYKRHFSKLKRRKISFPIALRVQKSIVNILSECEKEIKKLKELSKKYKEQKKGLMQKLLTGKIRLK